ncbi:MAG: hypothetical protein ACREKM_09545 [Longimicrobiales bacterium]
MRRCASAFALLAVTACRVAPVSLPEAPRDAATSRAALTTLVVDNRTARALDIGYQYFESGGGRVVIGHVPPTSLDTLPPVPAREPIALFAIDPEGAMLRLGPRALELDSTFVWTIPAGATFARPGP